MGDWEENHQTDEDGNCRMEVEVEEGRLTLSAKSCRSKCAGHSICTVYMNYYKTKFYDFGGLEDNK